MASHQTEIETESASSAGQWELASQFSRAWRVLKWSFTAIIALGFIVVIGQGFLFYRVFADVHPALGWAYVILLALILFLLVGRPLWSFFSTPVVAEPPDAPFGEGPPSKSDIAARMRYDLKYLKALSRNPYLADQKAAIADDLNAGRALEIKLSTLSAEDALEAISAFQRDRIEARLAAIDAQVDRLIHAEAVAVGVSTAVSMNGTIDAFIVLWRNANLVSRISRLYFGRPHLRGSLIILRDVAAIVVLSRALEDITSLTGEVIGGLLGRMGGLVAGPVMDGAVNAMMTLKLGYLTKRRCRSYQGWSAAQSRSITAEALARVKKESGSVVSELLKRCGGLTVTAARAGEKAMAGSKNAWGLMQSWFGVRGAKPEPE